MNQMRDTNWNNPLGNWGVLRDPFTTPLNEKPNHPTGGRWLSWNLFVVDIPPWKINFAYWSVFEIFFEIFRPAFDGVIFYLSSFGCSFEKMKPLVEHVFFRNTLISIQLGTAEFRDTVGGGGSKYEPKCQTPIAILLRNLKHSTRSFHYAPRK